MSTEKIAQKKASTKSNALKVERVVLPKRDKQLRYDELDKATTAELLARAVAPESLGSDPLAVVGLAFDFIADEMALCQYALEEGELDARIPRRVLEGVKVRARVLAELAARLGRSVESGR